MPTPVTVTEYDELIDYDANGRPIYQGWAKPRALSSNGALAIWKIQKFIYTGNFVTERRWAEANTNEDKIWNNRTSYTYYS